MAHGLAAVPLDALALLVEIAEARHAVIVAGFRREAIEPQRFREIERHALGAGL